MLTYISNITVPNWGISKPSFGNFGRNLLDFVNFIDKNTEIQRQNQKNSRLRRASPSDRDFNLENM